MKIFILAMVFILASCGSGGDFSRPSGDPTLSGSGKISVEILNSKSFDPKIDHARIVKYRVTVSGSEISPPIEAEFPGDATEGVVENVPEGDGYAVSVTAENENEKTIRAGEACCVDVGGGVSDVAVNLESVPIFANIENGASVDNTRLAFRIFSDAGEPVVVENMGGGTGASIADANTGLFEIVPDVATGLGKIAPMVMPAGNYKFRVKNLKTGRGSDVEVQLLDGTKKGPAPFFAAGFAFPDATMRAGAMCGFEF